MTYVVVVGIPELVSGGQTLVSSAPVSNIVSARESVGHLSEREHRI